MLYPPDFVHKHPFEPDETVLRLESQMPDNGGLGHYLEIAGQSDHARFSFMVGAQALMGSFGQAPFHEVTLTIQPPQSSLLASNRLEVSPQGRALLIDGEKLGHTDLEFTCVARLAAQPDEVVTYPSLIDAVWGKHDSRTLRQQLSIHMARLRRTLNDYEPALGAKIITTHRNLGYAACSTLGDGGDVRPAPPPKLLETAPGTTLAVHALSNDGPPAQIIGRLTDGTGQGAFRANLQRLCALHDVRPSDNILFTLQYRPGRSAHVVPLGDTVVVDTTAKAVCQQDQLVQLSSEEYRLLELFAENAGSIVTWPRL